MEVLGQPAEDRTFLHPVQWYYLAEKEQNSSLHRISQSMVHGPESCTSPGEVLVLPSSLQLLGCTAQFHPRHHDRSWAAMTSFFVTSLPRSPSHHHRPWTLIGPWIPPAQEGPQMYHAPMSPCPSESVLSSSIHSSLDMILKPFINTGGFPGGSVVKEATCNAGDAGIEDLILGSGRSPGGAWQPTAVFLPGKSQESTVHRVAKSWTRLNRQSKYTCTPSLTFTPCSCSSLPTSLWKHEPHIATPSPAPPEQSRGLGTVVSQLFICLTYIYPMPPACRDSSRSP